MPSDVAGCARFCLLDTFAEIQPPSAKWRLTGLLRGDAWPRTRRGAEPRAGERKFFEMSIHSTC